MNNQPRDKFMAINGLKLHYLEWGDPRKETVLLLHGFANCAATWMPVGGALSPYMHVVALDQRGHGDSQWADQERYRMADFVSDVAFLLDGLSVQKIKLVGHSMGSAVAQYFAAEYPGKVDRLVIVDNGPEIGEAVLKRILNHRTKVKTRFATLEEAADYLSRVDPLAPRELMLQETAYLTKKTDSGELTWKCHRMTSGSAGLPTEAELAERWEILGLITCPTLILRGAESGHLVRDVAEEMVKTMPRAELVEVEKAGHFIHRNNPGRFNELLSKFLEIETVDKAAVQ